MNNKFMNHIKQHYKTYLWTLFFVAFFIGPPIVTAVDDMRVRNQYLKDAFVSEGQIALTTIDSSKYYVKVALMKSANNVSLTDDMSYVEVTPDFYNKHKTGDKIGVLVGNYDIFKEKYFGLFGNQGQYFEKNIWGVENVFDTKQEADQVYPNKEFTDKAQVKTKTASKSNEFFFILSYQDREITAQVTQEQYQKYNENDYVDCDFQSIGDFIKIIDVK